MASPDRSNIKELLEKNSKSGRLFSAPLDALDDNPHQPRLAMSKAELEELIQSIADKGLLQPIVVRRAADHWQIIAGHRRAEAFRQLRARAQSDDEAQRWNEISALERTDIDDRKMHEFALIENLVRDDLNPVEVGRSIAAYQATYKLPTSELSAALGLEPKRLQRLLRLHGAPEVIKVGVTKGLMIDVGEARREHRTLELNAALEFVRLHKEWLSDDPKRDTKKIDARVERAITRALTEGWGLRRIQDYVQAQVAGSRPATDAQGTSVEGGGEPVEAGADAQPPPCFRQTDRRLSVDIDRAKTAPPEERARLRSALEAVLALLG